MKKPVVTISVNKEFLPEYLLLRKEAASTRFDNKPSLNRLLNIAMAYYVRKKYSKDSLESVARDNDLSISREI